MRYISIKSLSNVALAFLSMAVMVACSKKEEAPPADSLDVTLGKNTDLTLLNAAIKRAELTSFTQGDGPYTLFAPNNAAFTAFGLPTEAAINAVDKNLLVTILTFHLQPVLRTFVEIPTGPNAPMSTQGGFTEYSSKNLTTGDVFINGARVVTKDIKVSNGIIHVISKVLTPPLTNITGYLGGNTNYKLFLQAITKTATSASFTASPVTVFAPSNAAMVAAGYDSTKIANLTAGEITTLTAILKYHIVGTRIFSSDLKDGFWKTVNGASLAISSGGTKIAGISTPTPVAISFNDLAAFNGVLYGIEGLIKP
jgi:uncharacterized surface protein with fasciclin (FAS1) repeats